MKKMLILFCCVLVFSNSIAQNVWQELLPPTVNPYSIMVSSNGNAFVVFQDSLIRSTDNGQSWEYVCFAVTNGCAFGTSPTGVIYLYKYADSLRKSTDEGISWITLNIPTTSYPFLQDYTPINTNKAGDVFIQINNNPYWDTYRSTDEGNTWESIGPDSSEMIDITFNDELCIASFVKPGLGIILYRSYNNGDDWEIIPSAPNKIYTLFSAKNGTLYGGRIFDGSPPGYLFISLNNGISWEVVSGFNGSIVKGIAENKLGHIFLATAYGVYRSTDDGDSWHQINEGLTHPDCWHIAVDSSGYVYVTSGLAQRLFSTLNTTIPVELVSFTATLNDDKVHLKWQTATEINNHGFEIERKSSKSEWRTIGFKEGKGTITARQSYSLIDDNISSGKYQYRLKQIDFDGTFDYSESIEINVQIINSSSLEQNFPNPFNPTTYIQYQVPELSFVTLKVYDVLGNEVATLVNEEKPIGTYEVEFDGTELPSGIYFYQLKDGNFAETKKMVLIE